MLLPGAGVNAQRLLTLDEAMAISEASSPTMQAARLSRERSRQTLQAQKAALRAGISLGVNPIGYSNNRSFDSRYSDWYTYESLTSNSTLRIDQPILFTDATVSLVNTFGWQNTSSQSLGVTTDNKSYTNKLYLSISQPLFTYNRQKMNLKELELEVEDAEINYALQRLSVERQVSQLFYQVYMAQMNLDIAREELVNTQASRDAISDKVTTGLAAEVELYQADLNLSSARSAVRNREVSLENNKANLKQFIGMDLKESLLVTAVIDKTDSLDINMERAVEYGLNSRMELRQRKIDIEFANFQMTQTKALNEFKGSVSLALGITGDNEILSRMYDNPTRNPSVAVSFNIPIFDWGEKKARIRAQDAVLQTQTLYLESEMTGITNSISQSCRNIENYRAQIDIEIQNQQNARLTYEINQEKYRNGDLTSMDMNLYQTQLSSKKASMAQAQINYKMELLNLKIQTLYDFEKREQVVPQLTQ